MKAVGCRRWAVARGARAPAESGFSLTYSLKPRPRGFTLIELITTISVGAIVVSFAALFITTPMHTYAAQTRRAALVDSADSMLRLMSRDVRSSLPNSVRVTQNGNITALELLLTVDAARYRDDDAAAVADDLAIGDDDDEFTTIGQFQDTSNVQYLSIYNVGITGADAYELSNVITPASTAITIAHEGNHDRVKLSSAMKFEYGSPEHRVYLVSGPVTYLCDESTGTVQRYSGYVIQATQPLTSAGISGGASGLVAKGVSSCSFSYSPGTAQRSGLVTLDVTVADAASSERVRLLHQVHVENVP